MTSSVLLPSCPSRPREPRTHARLIGARKIGLILPFIGFAWQAYIDHSGQNLAAASLAAIGSYIVFYDSLRIHRLYSYPISTLVHFGIGFCLCLGPLIFTALEGKPISYNLDLPIITFFNAFLVSVVSTAAHALYRHSINLSHFRKGLNLLWLRLGLFAPLQIHEVIALGSLGMIAMSLSTLDGNIDAADANYKFLQGFRFLSAIPGAFLLQRLWLRDGDRKHTRFVASLLVFLVYFLITILVSIVVNKREIFVQPAANVLIGLIFAYLFGMIRFPVSGIIAILLALFLLMPILNNFSAAMLMARASRGVTPEELIQITFDQMRNPEGIEAWRQSNRMRGITLDPIHMYLENDFLAKLAPGKFMDYSHSLSQKISKSNSLEMLKYDALRLIAVLPTPLLTPFGYTSDLKLEILTGNAGDRFEALANNAPVSPGFKVMHFSGLGVGTYGYFYLILFSIFLLVAFPAFDAHSQALSRTARHVPILSIIAFSFLFEWFKDVPLQTSMVNHFWLLIRYMNEPILILAFARILLSPFRLKM